MNSGDIGRTIASIREEKGFSQKELAELIPVNQSNLSRWENGITIPSLQQLERTCEVLGISLELAFSQDKDEYVKQYNRLKMKVLKLKIILALVLVIIFLGIVIIVFPRYRVVGESDEYLSDYGETLRIYVEPVFFLTEKGAYAYGEKEAKRYIGTSDISVVEIIFVRDFDDIQDENNELFSSLYFLNSFSE